MTEADTPHCHANWNPDFFYTAWWRRETVTVTFNSAILQSH